ncbi:putative Alpha,alpha-trehalose-phosphate synthase [UDP-forming] A [Blattamonas nauphoetae]|uniref:Alpha,alpha-trehalose-phosphate synthase [UDP-forming] A n=1 Tax=Blattamonas nauphoetae TaxID=2049346 RepID=A0ABQ9YFG6_9EUKA|nr:putative Alpha,alpha-trehalose-phosphate synthase [UDP-forming] A [Blattamonas nauphoetae]
MYTEKSSQPGFHAVSSMLMFGEQQQESNITRFIIASNRLPITFERNVDYDPSKPDSGEKWHFKESSGGLIAGVKGITIPYTWIGWLGQGSGSLSDEEKIELTKAVKQKFGYTPVFIPDDIANLYYNVFSNQVLWPISHYLQFTQSAQNGTSWDAYCQANRAFADAISAVYEEGDAVWVHDYQLYMVPHYLRQQSSTVPIGFFLHIPFPSSELFRTLPQRYQLIDSLLDCNLVGFHTHDYRQHFVSTAQRIILDARAEGESIISRGRQTSCQAVPIGIDPTVWNAHLENPTVQKLIEKLKHDFAGVKLVIGCDRVDYTKGLPLKIKIIDQLLTTHKELHGKFVLFQIGIPSRMDVKEYQELTDELHKLIGEVNGKFGTIDWTPIHYIGRPVKQDELAAYYAVSDACLVTSVRDGMNLVALEYVCCQKDHHGALVLSEFAGARFLLSGSYTINPFDIENSAETLNLALSEVGKKASEKHLNNYKIVTLTNTAEEWGLRFAQLLLDSIKDSFFHLNETDKLGKDELIRAFRNCDGPRIFFLDYDGTLTKIVNDPMKAKPTQQIKNILRNLASLPRTTVFIVSGRDRRTLDEWFGDLPIGLVGEHGMCVKYCTRKSDDVSEGQSPFEKGAKEVHEVTDDMYEPIKLISDDEVTKTDWEPLIDVIDLSWMDTIKQIVQDYHTHTPGSLVEEKPTSVAFHFRNSDPTFGEKQAIELKSILIGKAASMPIEVMTGHFVVEVRMKGVNKGAMLRKILHRYSSEHTGDSKPFVITPVLSTQSHLSSETPPLGGRTNSSQNMGPLIDSLDEMMVPSDIPPTLDGVHPPTSPTGRVIRTSSSGDFLHKSLSFANQLEDLHPFIFCAGDDVTDEDMFHVVGQIPQSLTIHIGTQSSQAKKNLLSPYKLLLSLANLIHNLAGSSSNLLDMNQARNVTQETHSPTPDSVFIAPQPITVDRK